MCADSVKFLHHFSNNLHTKFATAQILYCNDADGVTSVTFAIISTEVKLKTLNLVCKLINNTLGGFQLRDQRFFVKIYTH